MTFFTARLNKMPTFENICDLCEKAITIEQPSGEIEVTTPYTGASELVCFHDSCFKYQSGLSFREYRKQINYRKSISISAWEKFVGEEWFILDEEW